MITRARLKYLVSTELITKQTEKVEGINYGRGEKKKPSSSACDVQS